MNTKRREGSNIIYLIIENRVGNGDEVEDDNNNNRN